MLTPTRIFGPGEGPDPAGTYDGGRLYDGGSGANTRIPPPWESAAAQAPQDPDPGTGRVPRRPAGTWRRVATHSAAWAAGEPGDGRKRAWIEEDTDGVYVLAQGATGIARIKVADLEQAEILARRLRAKAWR